MKITKRQLKRIIKEEVENQQLKELDGNSGPENGDHHWPRVDWDNIGTLVDKWSDMENASFDKGDPSMMPEDMTEKDAIAFWSEQVDDAAIALENELTQRVRKAALQAMKEISARLVNGEFV